jgi:methylated-DNA-[protein]-cysteine S-methyltransferase
MAQAIGFAVFETALGWGGIAWGEAGMVRVQLPEASEAGTRSRMQRLCPGLPELPPPPEAQTVIEGVAALLSGQPVDLSQVRLDWSGVPDFNRRVLEMTLALPPGRTLTYGDIAKRLGDVSLSRAVGQALGNNPFAPVVPCHRVLGAGGKLTGFSAQGGVSTKQRMLLMENARLGDEPDLFD